MTLVDSGGIKREFYLSPSRKVQRVTNPAVPVGPWYFELIGRDYSEELRSWQRADALWYKVLWPPTSLFVRLWRAILDLQCRAHALKLSAGFWGILFVIVVTAAGLATRTAPELSVAIGIIGAFGAERVWEWWRATTRRKLAKGINMRVRYKPCGPDTLRYGTLRLRRRGAIIVDGPMAGQPWSSTEMCLSNGQRVLATGSFANGIRGDFERTNSELAKALRHRLDDGSKRQLHAPSPKHAPDVDTLPDIVLSPSDRSFGLMFRDRDTNRGFSVQLKMHQVRTLADVLEVMDDGRRW